MAHPLLKQLETSRSESVAFAWEIDLNSTALSYLRDHCLQGMVILPGSFYIEMALAAAAAAYGELPDFLENITFHRVCVLTETTQLLRVVLSVRESGRIYFYAYEGSRDLEYSACDMTPYVEIAFTHKANRSTPILDHTNPRKIRARCADEMSGSDFYEECRERGNEYGLAFQGIKRLWRGDEEALGLLQIPHILESQINEYHLHPALLDASVHILTAARRNQSRSVILASVDQIHLHNPLRIPYWVHAQTLLHTQLDSDVVIGNIRLLDESGQSVMELQRVCFKYFEGDKSPLPLTHHSITTIAIAATFTAEPLAESIAFWMKTFATHHKIAFAPYGQLFQQLLSPSSLFSKNRNGVNVVLVRFEDWIQEDSNVVANVDGIEKEHLLGHRPRYTLPNRMEIAHLNPYETEYLYDEIFLEQSYFKHGITLHDGDCVIDAGANIGLFTLFVQQKCVNTRVYAFEPSPRAFEALDINVILYGSNVTTFNCGLSNTNTDASFTFYRNSSVFSSFHADRTQDRLTIRAIIRNVLLKKTVMEIADLDFLADQLTEERLESDTVTCQLRTLSSVIRERHIERIDLLKVDVEKSELEVLEGIEEKDWGIIGQIVLEVHDPEGKVIEKITSLLQEKGFNVVVGDDKLLRDAGLHNIYAHRPARGMGIPAEEAHTTEPHKQLEQNVRDLVYALRAVKQRSQTPHLVYVCPASPGVLQATGQELLFQQLEQWMASELDDVNTVHLVRSFELLTNYPMSSYFDPHGDVLGHIPYTMGCFTALGTMIARKYQALQRDPYKVVVLDCDQTLWTGVCGEDGPLGIEIDPVRQKLQEFIVQQHDTGMLVCLCSKNNQDDVIAVFERHPEMPLKRDHIVAWRINWRLKSDNIKSLANELGLGLTSFIFIDDDPVECAEVQAHCPEVLTLQLPTEIGDIPRYLESVWAFDHFKTTKEDKQRTHLYQQNAQRENFRHASPTFGSFLAGLALQIQISAPTSHHLARVAQLTQRVNQFNFTALTRSEAEVQEVFHSGLLECLIAEVSDRFGNYGLVGAILFRVNPEAVIVDTFLLSCRVLGKGVEHRMLARLGEIAAERGLARVDVPYVASGKNQPALDFLESVGDEYREPLGDHALSRFHLKFIEEEGSESLKELKKGILFKFPVNVVSTLTFDPEAAEAKNLGFLVKEGMSAASAEGEFTSRARVTPSLLSRIATELHDVNQILDTIENQKCRQRPHGTGAFIPPNSELEKTIAGIWQKVLGVAPVGVTDNFFELGGTSLLAVQVIAQLHRVFGTQISTVSLFARPTIRAVADRLRSGNREQGRSAQIGFSRSRGERRRGKNKTRGRPTQ